MAKTLASATVGRPMHHAHVRVTTGDSVRLQQATTGTGEATHLRLSGRTGRQRAALVGASARSSMAIDNISLGRMVMAP